LNGGWFRVPHFMRRLHQLRMQAKGLERHYGSMNTTCKRVGPEIGGSCRLSGIGDYLRLVERNQGDRFCVHASFVSPGPFWVIP
jgi:hypothetical protein